MSLPRSHASRGRCRQQMPCLLVGLQKLTKNRRTCGRQACVTQDASGRQARQPFRHARDRHSVHAPRDPCTRLHSHRSPSRVRMRRCWTRSAAPPTRWRCLRWACGRRRCCRAAGATPRARAHPPTFYRCRQGSCRQSRGRDSRPAETMVVTMAKIRPRRHAVQCARRSPVLSTRLAQAQAPMALAESPEQLASRCASP
jgi:hypothetical protein